MRCWFTDGEFFVSKNDPKQYHRHPSNVDTIKSKQLDYNVPVGFLYNVLHFQNTVLRPQIIIHPNWEYFYDRNRHLNQQFVLLAKLLKSRENSLLQLGYKQITKKVLKGYFKFYCIGFRYLQPEGLFNIPEEDLDLRPDVEIDEDLLHPKPLSDEKSIWFFWHSGYEYMHPYTKRNIRGWHRRFSRQGWTVRVVNCRPNSKINISNYLDVSDSTLFPQAFRDSNITGEYALQHTSDLVRFPLLLKHGGIYADVGLIQIGDIDRLWRNIVVNPVSPFEVVSYNCEEVSLTNYFFMIRPKNQFFMRCHRLLLKLWEGKTNTEGMWNNVLLKGVPVMECNYSIEENGKIIDPESLSRILTDYISQGQVISMVMGLVDAKEGWDGPRYSANHIYGIDYMVGSQLINSMTNWDGTRAFKLMSLSVATEDKEATKDQAHAKKIVTECLSKSFGFKLAHGLILRVLGDTLGSLWKKYEGSDNVPYTYVHWLRYDVLHWNQSYLPQKKEFKIIGPHKVGRLLEEE